jgi:MMPL family
MAGSGAVVMAAGLVFAATMASFVFADLRILGQIGTTIALGLLFDTLIVRSFMTPSIAALLGPTQLTVTNTQHVVRAVLRRVTTSCNDVESFRPATDNPLGDPPSGLSLSSRSPSPLTPTERTAARQRKSNQINLMYCGRRDVDR